MSGCPTIRALEGQAHAISVDCELGNGATLASLIFHGMMKWFSTQLVFSGCLTTYAAACCLLLSKESPSTANTGDPTIDLVMMATLLSKVVDMAALIKLIVHVIGDFEQVLINI